MFGERPSIHQLETLGALAALVGYFAIRCLYLTVDYFVDEADNLAGGRLIAEGYTLYGDFFSHHFPFPYWWLAAVFKLFGPSVFSARFSLLALEILAWAIVMRLVGRVWSLGLSLIAWGLVQYLYWGHMTIYYSFSRIGFFVPFILVFLASDAQLNRIRTRFIIWFFTVMAVLADPFMVLSLGLVHLRWLIRRGVLPYGRELGVALAGSGLGLGILVVLGTFSVAGFFNDAVVFNLETYRKYSPAFADPLGNWVRNLASGLELFDRRWLNTDLLSALDVDGASRRLFTGFFFRLAVLMLATGLLMTGRVVDGIGFYIVSAALLARLPEFFHSGPFVMVSVTAAALLVGGLPGRLWTGLVGVCFRGFMAAGMVWLSLRAGAVLGDPGLGEYHRQMVSWFESDARVAERLTCDRSDVALGDYPEGVYLNFLTGRRPTGGYGLLWPWMAEWGLAGVIERLKAEPAIVRVHLGAQVGPFKANEYLSPLIDFLSKNFVAVDGFYVAPGVVRDCPSVRPYLNYLAALIQTIEVPSRPPVVVLTDEPHLLDYVSKLVGRGVRAADPRSALLVPGAGVCFLAAPSWVSRELEAWGFHQRRMKTLGDRVIPWPVICSDGPERREPVAEWEGSVALEWVAVGGQVRPGDELEVTALWRYEGTEPAGSLHVFHHLVVDGRLIAQADGPLDGTFGRQPGDLIGTRYRIRVPEDLDTGRYELLVGLYRFPELERIKTTTGIDAVRVGP